MYHITAHLRLKKKKKNETLVFKQNMYCLLMVLDDEVNVTQL